jgi:4-hydroxybenzoate polyprenyltransferase
VVKGLDALLKKYLFLSLIVACLTYFTYLSTATLPNYGYILFSGIVTYILYNYHMLFRFDLNYLKQQWPETSGRYILLILCFITCVLLFRQTFAEILAFGFACILALGYFIPFTTHNKSLRDFLWLKPLTIGAVFAILTATIPYHHGGYSWFESSQLSLGRLFFVASLAILFDIGDVVEDHLQKVKTLPQTYGTGKAKMIASIFLMLAALIEGYGAWTFLLEVHGIVSLLFTYMIAWTLLVFASDRRSWWYYLVLVDGVMGSPLLFFWMLKEM